MSKAHRLKTRKPKALTESFVPLHFLVGCSDHSLGEFELARLAEVADLRRELHATHGRQPGSLAACEMLREKKTRAVLAELGISPESAAVSLKAAKETLLRVMPDSKAKAMSPADLRQAATVPSKTTGDKALRELLSAGKIQRIGKARSGHPFRYFK